ncbi:MAG: dihydrodipicolinate synthase family protein [Sedimentisphaerales bacterium]|nr:dihydrodipicolinate synthase family protein [Sedimentisphaerales bacterium]
MDQNKQRLSGVFAPVVTPFIDDVPDLDALAYNLAQLRKTNLKGYLALGSNGEYKSLTDEERLLVLKVFAEEKGDKVVMVGTGCESTRETIEKSHIAAQMDFDYVSVLTPHYFPKQMDGSALRRYYERIAEAVSAPVLLYNAPQFAGGVQIPSRTVAELSKHPNVAGMKDSSAAGPARFLADVDPDEDFCILAGSMTFFYSSLHIGAAGGVLSLANIVPDACVELHDLFTQGQYERARELNAGLTRLNQAISGTWGVAGVKAAMDLVGLKGGRPREPLMPAPDEAVAQIQQALIAEGFLVA